MVLDKFQGWENAKGWKDLSFSKKNDAFIEKLAIVGDEKWRDDVDMFTFKGLRPVPIQYFGAEEVVAARRWLNAII